MTAANPLAVTPADATRTERLLYSEARAHLAARAATPPRVPMLRILVACSSMVVVEMAGMLVAGASFHDALLPCYVTLMVTFGFVFCWGAVSVAGFIAGGGAAGLVALEATSLYWLLGGAALLALTCGIAPGWARVEAWQAMRGRRLTAGEEAAVAQRPLVGSGGRYWRTGVRLRSYWATDRVLAAFLVLSFPPTATALGLALMRWMENR